jgi:3-hydroxybutyryl-CoA dehydrogenase
VLHLPENQKFPREDDGMTPWQIAVVGTGLMGRGIAELFARNGHAVRIFDSDPALAAQTAAEISRGHTGTVRHFDRLEATVRGCSLVIEAVAEQLDIKLDVLRGIEDANRDAIIASNTSTFLPSRLSTALRRPERLLIAHFFNPAAHVPLVEIVNSEHTLPAVTEALVGLLKSVGKTPVVLGRETPGFIANRLQAAVLREALFLVRDGVATYQQIDDVMTSSIGPRWSVAGPFQIADLGGLDVFSALTRQLFPQLDVSQERPQEITDHVEAGRLGAKSGEGFHAYTPVEIEQLRARIVDAFSQTSTRIRANAKSWVVA